MATCIVLDAGSDEAKDRLTTIFATLRLKLFLKQKCTCYSLIAHFSQAFTKTWPGFGEFFADITLRDNNNLGIFIT